MQQSRLQQILLAPDKVDWLDLAQQAHALRVQRFGLKTSFVETHNINFTNVCTLGCAFCAFAHAPSSPEAVRFSQEQIIQKLGSVPNLSEVCLQGGIDPHYGYQDYLGLVQVIRKNFPKIHIHAFSPQEVHHLTEISKKSLEQVMLDLKQAGVNSLPGTAAEILVDEVRQSICPQKISSQRWLDIVKLAHQLGLPTSATILFGHIETPDQIATHFQKIRALQEQTGGFTEFVLLPFIPYHTRLGKNQAMISLEKIKQLVILARLFFDQTIPHIQMSWPKVGLEFALQMLACGSNDVGGTLHEENISRLAGSKVGGFCSKADLAQGILKAGFLPWERDTLYQKVPALAMA